MTQQKNTGMRLRQAMNPRKKDATWLIQMIVAILASSVLTFTLTGLTGNTWIVMLVVSAWLCIVYGILLKTRHENWFYIRSTQPRSLAGAVRSRVHAPVRI